MVHYKVTVSQKPEGIVYIFQVYFTVLACTVLMINSPLRRCRHYTIKLKDSVLYRDLFFFEQ